MDAVARTLFLCDSLKRNNDAVLCSHPAKECVRYLNCGTPAIGHTGKMSPPFHCPAEVFKISVIRWTPR